MIFRRSWSERCLKKPRTIFSAKVTDGANRVALAQLLIADNNAPKNMTWAMSGAWFMINFGNIIWGSVSKYWLTKPGLIMVAEYAKYSGTKAKMKYSTPPRSAAWTAIFTFFEEVIRWNTSCCGMEPSIIVHKAATNPRMEAKFISGQKLNLPAAEARSITTPMPPVCAVISPPI